MTGGDHIQIARVFPRRTAATPDDALAFTTPPPKDLTDIGGVHVSVAFYVQQDVMHIT